MNEIPKELLLSVGAALLCAFVVSFLMCPMVKSFAYKIGAMLGDFVEVGCNSVLNPGTIIGKHTNIYPLSRVRGVIMADSIYKSADNIVLKENR